MTSSSVRSQKSIERAETDQQPVLSEYDATALRRKAQKKIEQRSRRLVGLPSRDTQHLIDELYTNQIELAMENEELRRAQEETETFRRKYADLYDVSPVGYFDFDRNGLIQEVNRTGAGMLGLEKRNLISRPIMDFIEPRCRMVFRTHLTEVFRAQTRQACEINLRAVSGVLIPSQLQSIGVYGGKGTIDFCRTAVSDCEGFQEAEEEVRRLNRDLQNSLLELKAVNIDLESFTSSVSSDLRTPLRRIEGFTNAILEDYGPALDETGRDYIQRVVSASRRMSQLIDALSNMARLTKAELKEWSVDLSGLAEMIVHELKRKQPERPVETVIASGLHVHGDTDMLRAVLENLLDNAWKFTSKHPRTKIEFGSIDMNGQGVYFVRDDGAGFETKFADRLFQPFKRLHRESEFPGLGMGLAIARRIIVRHGGRIWAEGEVEKGTTVYFTL
jgi:PAS domain S-box-containing protein